ncbi:MULTISPECIES: respiratory chain complex I subunit 1 family protein [unclassified Fusibacter]|uniref:respiratory chain complex I subunit 1 family protein n=1 Tax=unclassified Fusibacter TaxID=2624464 RepID=UPI0010124F69|nr:MULTISPECIES: NADH-quinone oxidoreductase subunit H [unclassified Fusibacter]MCK8060056.1 NADH-quinone oxidoreductase subunit H [Fusibacter sp. A2]NPE22198.1 proton-conducting membrane transporter [Fusibacter sp. A1]RXV60974.1 proton-conducting membrane transporter [Fusibacter sp. A1]
MTLMNFIYGFLVLIGAFVFQTTLTGINRKITARIQKRRGPKFYQQFIDIFKALSKSSITHGWVYDFGAIMALGGIAATVIFIPVAGFQAFPGLDNVFVISYVLAVGMLGMAMSAAGSGNPWASIGVSRALTNMLAYDIPLMVVVFTLIFINKSGSVADLALLQQGSGVFGWNFIKLPLGGIVAVVALFGMLGKKPFDSFIAPAEIASGPMVEYGGKQLGMMFILHELMTFIEVSLILNMFFGGGETLVIYLIKYALLYTFTNIVSQVMPRFKIDQAVLFFFRVPLGMALLQGILVIFLGWGY